MEKMDFTPLTVTLTEEERQTTLLAYAYLAVERPSTEPALSAMVEKLQGKKLFDGFVRELVAATRLYQTVVKGRNQSPSSTT